MVPYSHLPTYKKYTIYFGLVQTDKIKEKERKKGERRMGKDIGMERRRQEGCAPRAEEHEEKGQKDDVRTPPHRT